MAPYEVVDTLIIGAGPTGLGAASQLHAAGDDDWLLVDAATGPGGMAITEVDDAGFRWDYGGHVIHSHYDVFDRALAQHPDWAHPTRGGWVRVQNAWCPTPIQRNLGSLPAGAKIAAEISSRGPADIRAIADLGAYYDTTFGPTLNELFFAPFNRKQWGWPLDELAHTWTSLRAGSSAANVPAPTINLEPRDAPEDLTVFPYPTHGTGSLWQSVAKTLPSSRQRYNLSIERIDLDARVAHLSSGEALKFNRCLSTMPLFELLSRVQGSRPKIAELRHRLRFTSTYIVGLGFAGPLPESLRAKTWIFAADADVPFHRATVLTNVSPALSGEGRWQIMFETSVSPKREVDTGKLAEVLRGELRRWGIEDEPVSVWERNLHYGYPLPFSGRDELLTELLPQLEELGVYPRGRFGGWRYESSNQDYAFAQGVEAVELFKNGKEETVYWPNRPGGPVKV